MEAVARLRFAGAAGERTSVSTGTRAYLVTDIENSTAQLTRIGDAAHSASLEDHAGSSAPVSKSSMQSEPSHGWRLRARDHPTRDTTKEAAGGIEPPYGALQLQKRGSWAFA